MLTTFWLLAAKIWFLHPFHVSVCDLTYKSDDKHLKISVRMFLDDLETGFREYTGEEKLDILTIDSTKLYGTLEAYLSENFVIKMKGKPLELVYLGGEVEDNVMWCYLEKEKIRPFNHISVTNTILTGTFPDQENLVHVRKDGVVKSMRLNQEEIEKTVSWED